MTLPVTTALALRLTWWYLGAVDEAGRVVQQEGVSGRSEAGC
jgi:hypothetical protein